MHTRSNFSDTLKKHSAQAEAIKQSAGKLHASVNHLYDDDTPYSIHLDMVAENTARYADDVIADEEDVLAVYFAAYYHDSIEDARLTYNNVYARALTFLNERQALMATEIVYALTNEKGRTRAERANEKYYHGIRTTPYAPLVKAADRLANTSYSLNHKKNGSGEMKKVYFAEMPHFLESIQGTGDKRLTIPRKLFDELIKITK